jgi:hypothetical protein
VDPRQPSAGLPEARDEPEGDRVRSGVEDDRGARRGCLGGERDRRGQRIDQVDPFGFERARRRLDRLEIAPDVVDQEHDMLSVFEAELSETEAEPGDGVGVRPTLQNHADAVDARLLRVAGHSCDEQGNDDEAPKGPPPAVHTSLL